MRITFFACLFIFFSACKHSDNAGSGLATDDSSNLPDETENIDPSSADPQTSPTYPVNQENPESQFTKSEFIDHCRSLINMPVPLCRNILLPLAVQLSLLTQETCKENCSQQKGVTMRVLCQNGCESYVAETSQHVESYSFLSEKFLSGACKEKTIPLRQVFTSACKQMLENGRFKDEQSTIIDP